MTNESESRQQARENLNKQFEKAKRRAQDSKAQQTESLKTELGRVVFDLAEEKFPEEAQQRKRQSAATAFGVGLAVGFLARHVLGR
ncbi:hypothetical protein [Haloarcula amylovorans]|uniref:hypothetical protein n=1 Tax=Haloarcula amylovorans TaxID=2562280 RepID=UPI0010767F81|nr:hypothetical protein [Halomicroarcula amylolytica]